MPGYTRARGTPPGRFHPPIGRFNGIAEEEDDAEAGGPVSPGERSHANIGDHPSASDETRGMRSGGFGSSTPQGHPTSSLIAHMDETSDHTADSRRGSKEMTETDPSLVVFKMSWAMVEEVLWKDQVGTRDTRQERVGRF